MFLHDTLVNSTQKYPKKCAIKYGSQKLTYTELDSLSNRFAQGLIGLHFKRNDIAALYLESSVEYAIALYGVLKAGGTFVPVNPQVKPSQLAYIASDCQISVIITDVRHAKHLGKNNFPVQSLQHIIMTDYSSIGFDIIQQKDSPLQLSKTPYAFHVFENIITTTESDTAPESCSIDIDLASLIYTSGSTSNPKGVMLTHQNMVCAANSIITYLENTPGDIILNCLPFSFDYGLYQLLMSVTFGGTIVLERGFLFPSKIVDQLKKEHITGFPLVPAFSAVLMRMKDLKENEFPDLRYITNTGQALPENHISWLRHIFPKTKIYSMYGLTECKRVSYLPPDKIDQKPLSVGIAMPNTEVWLEDDEGKRIDTPGVIGELVVRGANVMKGYWNNYKATQKVLKPGILPGESVLKTGDYFKIDDDGYLYFINRKDDMIKSGGERISPKEIENVLYRMSDIVEAAVVPMPDEILGNAIKAFVALKKDSHVSVKDIKKHCSLNLESFKVPKEIAVLNELPKSRNGKILKTRLVTM